MEIFDIQMFTLSSVNENWLACLHLQIKQLWNDIQRYSCTSQIISLLNNTTHPFLNLCKKKKKKLSDHK